MSLKNMTLEELEELEQELHDQEEESDYSLYYRKIKVYEEMYNRLRKLVREKKEDKSYLENVTKMLVFNLIHYGTYLKMQYEKDDETAIHCLKKALNYDSRNPIAAYRLGFLSYKHKDYESALHNFQMSIDHQKFYDQTDYRLNEKQIVNAHLYLTNSALHIAKNSYDRMIGLPYKSYQELPNYEFSSLYQSLTENEKYLEMHAFYKISQEETTTCSKEECEKLITEGSSDTIVLYFNDRNIKLIYNENEVNISQYQGDMLRYLLTKSSVDSPATRITFHNFFLDSHVKGVVNEDTFKKAISRLRNKLRSCEIPPIIQTTNYRGETAYYFDRTMPYIVMYRVDEEIEYLS
ncbi:hypothetical protein C0966_05415 [Bacillus methanolicus]|uniref:tetratricopeptide repeat protein n=1 Tax=Bacillus methanolicus TaxID=1471 RepID=UPI0023804680|nr:hypothetical protein [Bacillus methanolicus]MDE3838818.1 hypothetical protein [Bacillus methanolicus]